MINKLAVISESSSSAAARTAPMSIVSDEIRLLKPVSIYNCRMLIVTLAAETRKGRMWAPHLPCIV